jgi:S1-C subfamily serine protease
MFIPSCYFLSTNASSSYLTVPESIAQSTLTLRSREFNPEIAAEIHDSALGSGTYLLINDHPYVLTAAHVIPRPSLQIVSLGGNEFQLSVSRLPMLACHRPHIDSVVEECVIASYLEDQSIFNQDMDLALIRLTAELNSARPAHLIANYEWTIGEAIWASGSPMGVLSINRASITGYLADSFVLTDTAIWFGSSGGGVYNSHGYLIGVERGVTIDRNVPTPGVISVIQANRYFTLISELPTDFNY